MSIKNTVTSVLGTSLIGGGSLGAIYGSTRETILSQLKNKVLLSKNLSDWKELEKIVKSKKEKSEIKNNYDLLGEIKDKIGEENNEGNLLKKWCEEQYSLEYSSIFKKYEERNKNKDLVAEICSIKIEEKIGSENLVKDKSSDSSNLETKVAEIKKDKNKWSIISSSNSSSSKDDKDRLLDWCKGKYNDFYQTPDEKNWLLVEKYCKKQ